MTSEELLTGLRGARQRSRNQTLIVSHSIIRRARTKLACRATSAQTHLIAPLRR
jgi:hypothetical protein